MFAWLITYQNDQDAPQQPALQESQLDTLRTCMRLARRRGENGYTSYIEELDGERSLFNTELSDARIQDTVYRSLVNLHTSATE